MFAANTVFVIGAGASAEFGMPVGSALTTTIKQNCKYRFEHGTMVEGVMPIFNYYRSTYDMQDPAQLKQVEERFHIMMQIHQSIDMHESIDEYIYRYSDNPVVAEIGKLQVAYAISRAESECLLSEKKDFHFDKKGFDGLNGTWIYAFAKALMNGVKASDIETIGNDITIICFNYDRCIEHYLEHAICRAYAGVTQDVAREIVSRIDIIHPYGVLGPLKAFQFGHTDRIWEMSENLITWSETIRDPQIIHGMTNAIDEAETLVFMGFAFATQNMDLMRGEADPRGEMRRSSLLQDVKDVYATAFRLRPQVHSKMKLKIMSLWTHEVTAEQLNAIHIEDDKTECSGFMQTNLMNLVK
ncbi:hypothetical protein RLEG12_33000 [Rhizobium leguminosarum bv. trifolii CB782]|nr:hypothetical protein RLEG12_33000 [Rhizobium leguminosarum bv. trifolii CB782]